jgi:hypothetical protein
MSVLRSVLALAVVAGAGYGLARAARRSNTQVHRINQ